MNQKSRAALVSLMVFFGFFLLSGFLATYDMGFSFFGFFIGVRDVFAEFAPITLLLGGLFAAVIYVMMTRNKGS